MNEIKQTLDRFFEKHRIILWYDEKRELHEEYEALALPDVEKIALGNNQFGVKYRILRQEPGQKFLLYHAGPPPDDLDNWLLDVQLSHGVFRADQTALWLAEIGLGMEFAEVVAPHVDFFKSGQRRGALKALLQTNDSPRQVLLKMTAVCANAEPRLDAILENLLAELAAEEDDRLRLIRRCELESFLWQQAERLYGYHSETPGIQDLAIHLFKAAYAQGVGEAAQLSNDAILFLQRWQDSTRFRTAFETLSANYARILNIAQDLEERPYRQLLTLDLFELIDQKILSHLAHEVAERTIDNNTCADIVHQRRQSHWYEKYAHPYEAIRVAAYFLHTLDRADLTIRSFGDGLQQYQKTWYLLDQLYRQFISHVRQSGQMTLLERLLEEVDNRYTNQFLLPLNDRWQSMVDGAERWTAVARPRQADFFNDQVAPFLRRDNKLFVIISDGLRYEAGEELARLIRQEDRYEADLSFAVTGLPSFTQLGMAALLPHETLTVAEDGGTVLVNGQNAAQNTGQSTAGTENRKKILQAGIDGKGTAVKADTLLNMSREESRALFRDHDVVYVYHNRIDATGDKRETEERTFDAVAETLDELIRIIKKLANANVSNMVITADHGFIYQHRPLDESDFAGQKATGKQIISQNRRFVLGRGLTTGSSFKWFTAEQVGLAGDLELLLPKSINRLRVRGAGSRYVHGGASLQEIMVPVIQINKKRQSDISLVAVDILRSGTSLITSGQLTVSFYQDEPVTDKVQPRILRAGLYTQAGDLISNLHELHFDKTDEHPRRREQSVKFMLTRKAEEANNQEVILRLDERIGDTSHYQEYKSARYTLRRSFTTDFDI
jgi:uncharacterized protein (TIGR02687 family)